jgi:dihydroxyacetone kinase/dihydroxyacetone kinase-like protein
MTASLDDVALVVQTMARTAVENEGYFGDLDAVVGDGDFGYSMARGFEVVLGSWDDIDRSSIGSLLKGVAMMITGRMGGTSGPIWGTAFLRAAAVAGDRCELETDDVIAMLRAAIEGVKQRGKADLGDKTLLDACAPAVEQLAVDLAAGVGTAVALREAAAVADRAAGSTRQLIAKRGRASYSGERSIGTLDAGAVAVALMLNRIAEQWAGPTPGSQTEE